MASATRDDLLCQVREPRRLNRKALEKSALYLTWPQVADTVIKAQAHMRGLMEQEGLPYDERTHSYNSRLAQELGKWADTYHPGNGLQWCNGALSLLGL
jgi:hypothetical protein